MLSEEKIHFELISSVLFSRFSLSVKCDGRLFLEVTLDWQRQTLFEVCPSCKSRLIKATAETFELCFVLWLQTLYSRSVARVKLRTLEICCFSWRSEKKNVLGSFFCKGWKFVFDARRKVRPQQVISAIKVSVASACTGRHPVKYHRPHLSYRH